MLVTKKHPLRWIPSSHENVLIHMLSNNNYYKAIKIYLGHPKGIYLANPTRYLKIRLASLSLRLPNFGCSGIVMMRQPFLACAPISINIVMVISMTNYT